MGPLGLQEALGGIWHRQGRRHNLGKSVRKRCSLCFRAAVGKLPRYAVSPRRQWRRLFPTGAGDLSAERCYRSQQCKGLGISCRDEMTLRYLRMDFLLLKSCPRPDDPWGGLIRCQL